MSPQAPAAPVNKLALGWVMTPGFHPAYWLQAGSRPGGQNDEEHLVGVPAVDIGTHLAFIAQSGAGKSFLLGRLIEEIVLKTRSRCVILDPNADFRRFNQVAPASLWRTAKYDQEKEVGRLPHEPTRDAFLRQWPADEISIRTARLRAMSSPYERLQLSWPSLSMDVMAEDVEPMLRGELYHCHGFVRALANLTSLQAGEEVDMVPILAEAEQMLSDDGHRPRLRRDLERRFKPDRDAAARLLAKVPLSVTPQQREGVEEWYASQVRSHIETMVRARNYVSSGVQRFYFSKTRSLERDGMIGPYVHPIVDRRTPKRIEVIDLPSVKDKATQLLAVSGVVASEWETARNEWELVIRGEPDYRVPTFVVVDEAHNLIPADTGGRIAAETVRDQFRSIAAEGRKYGLFLIMVSQRPDKLDRMVLSECENAILMRIGSPAVLEEARKTLGLEGVPGEELNACLGFGVGRALLTGRFAKNGHEAMFCAARRTVEGGKNLRSEYWAVPPGSPVVPPSPPRRPRRQQSRSARGQGAGLRRIRKAAPSPKPPTAPRTRRRRR